MLVPSVLVAERAAAMPAVVAVPRHPERLATLSAVRLHLDPRGRGAKKAAPGGNWASSSPFPASGLSQSSRGETPAPIATVRRDIYLRLGLFIGLISRLVIIK